MEDFGSENWREEAASNTASQAESQRPSKRMKMDQEQPYGTTSAFGFEEDPIDGVQRPVVVRAHPSSVLTVPVPGYQLAINEAETSNNPFSAASVPAIQTGADSVPATTVDQSKKSLKMTILPKSEVDTLKSHNNILRSHNLSLSRQNSILRREHAEAIFDYEEIKGTAPLDHSDCVHKDDYQQVLTQNQDMGNVMARLRREHQLMHECGQEWARREKMWEVEQRLLKTEVTGLVKTIEEMKARENEMMAKLRFFEGQAHEAERRAEENHARATGLQVQLNHIQMRIHASAQFRAQVLAQQQMQNQAQDDTGRVSEYPEL